VGLTSQSLWSRRGLRRGQDLIRRSDSPHFQLVLYLRSATMLDHNGRQVELVPGDMTLIDTSRPYDGWHESGVSRLLNVSIPRALLPVSPSATDKLVGARLCGRTGVGALLWDYVLRAAEDLDDYSPADATRISTILLDLLGGLVSHELELNDELSGESQQRVLYQQIQRFIQRQLADPELTPATIAETHHIFVRTLHRLFGSHGHTVTEWIAPGVWTGADVISPIPSSRTSRSPRSRPGGDIATRRTSPACSAATTRSPPAIIAVHLSSVRDR
jgi:hypothetical protein